MWQVTANLTNLITATSLWIHNGHQVIVTMNYILKHFAMFQKFKTIRIFLFNFFYNWDIFQELFTIGEIFLMFLSLNTKISSQNLWNYHHHYKIFKNSGVNTLKISSFTPKNVLPWRAIIEVSKLFYLIDLDKIYQMRPNLLKSDVSFKFYAPITLHFWTFKCDIEPRL